MRARAAAGRSAHRPRRAARHRSRRARDIDGVAALRHRRPAGRRARATARSAASEARRPRPSSRTEIQRFAALARLARGPPDDRRAARARRRRSPAGRWPRTPGAGRGCGARPRARRGDRPRGGQAPAARADAAHEGHGRRPTAATAACRSCASCSGLDGAGRGARARPTVPRRCLAARTTRVERPADRDARAARSRWRRPDAVAEALGGEVVVVRTSGDRRARAAGDKERWVQELEQALLAGEIDLAVHSAKDVPAELPDGPRPARRGCARRPARRAVRRARRSTRCPPGARVGTSSLRRAAQLRAAREDLEVVALRGNVDTRLRKLADGDCDAIVLAAAGLRRLGRERRRLRLTVVPAAGPGRRGARGPGRRRAGAEAAIARSPTPRPSAR